MSSRSRSSTCSPRGWSRRPSRAGGTMIDASRTAVDSLRCEVTRRYGVPREAVRVVRSPYRVCPLGAHIDHQLGPVTAMAIDRSVLLAYAPSPSREVSLGSLDFPGLVRF